MGLNPIGNPEWPKQTAELLEKFTGQVREGVTNKAVFAVRGVVFGLIALFGALIAGVLVLIVALRALQILFAWPFDHDTSVWIAYLVVGGLFSLVGWLLMSKRHSSSGS